MTDNVIFSRTFFTFIDTILAVIGVSAILEVFLKATFFYASGTVVL